MLNFQVDLIDTDLRTMKTVELRKLAASGGLKGQSSARKEHLLGLLEPIQMAQVENMEKVAAQVKAAVDAKVNEGVDATAGDDSEAAKKARRSRRGMVIVAKGTEVHKSQTFKVAAEAAGWTVTVTGEVYDGETEATRYYADAYKGENAIQLAWDGRAYDYPASSALINGKNRKIRNLKEALRILAS